MGVGCRGGGQSYSACVRESPAGREPAVCALSLRRCVRRRAGKGSSWSTWKCVCDESEIPAAQGDLGSSPAEPAQRDAGDCRKLFYLLQKSTGCCHKL